MKRLLTLLGAAGALSLLAIGCGTDTTVITSGNDKPGITVSGEGSVFGEPDVALATLGVQADAASVGDARSQAAASMDAMLKALKDGGVAEKDIQTTQFSVEPRYDFSNNKQQLIGFTVTNTATVKIHEIDKTGELVDAAITAGGDLARVQGLQFTIDDPSALQDEARQKAMADAKRRADTLAQAAGIELGDPRSIAEGGGPAPIMLGAAESAAFLDQARTPIETGQLEVKIQVSVVYGLK